MLLKIVSSSCWTKGEASTDGKKQFIADWAMWSYFQILLQEHSI